MRARAATANHRVRAATGDRQLERDCDRHPESQMPRDRLAACAYCRRLLGRALQNELCFISYSATQLEIEFKLLSLELKS